MKTFFISILLTFISFQGYSQYQLDKIKYSPLGYKHQSTDPYNPIAAGVASYFIPGLGQFYCGEPSRGATFLLGYVGSLGVMTYGISKLSYNNPRSTRGQGGLFLLTGIGGAFTTYIWSIADAVQVAKVKNLKFRDIQKTSFKIQPALFNTNNTNTLGLQLTLSF